MGSTSGKIEVCLLGFLRNCSTGKLGVEYKTKQTIALHYDLKSQNKYFTICLHLTHLQ